MGQLLDVVNKHDALLDSVPAETLRSLMNSMQSTPTSPGLAGALARTLVRWFATVPETNFASVWGLCFHDDRGLELLRKSLLPAVPGELEALCRRGREALDSIMQDEEEEDPPF